MTKAAEIAELINEAQPEDEAAVAYSYGEWKDEFAYFDDGSVLYWEPGEFAMEMIKD